MVCLFQFFIVFGETLSHGVALADTSYSTIPSLNCKAGIVVHLSTVELSGQEYFYWLSTAKINRFTWASVDMRKSRTTTLCMQICVGLCSLQLSVSISSTWSELDLLSSCTTHKHSIKAHNACRISTCAKPNLKCCSANGKLKPASSCKGREWGQQVDRRMYA